MLEAPDPNGQMIELLEGHAWQEPRMASTSHLCADAPTFVPAASMGTLATELQGQVANTENAKEIGKAETLYRQTI